MSSGLFSGDLGPHKLNHGVAPLASGLLVRSMSAHSIRYRVSDHAFAVANIRSRTCPTSSVAVVVQVAGRWRARNARYRAQIFVDSSDLMVAPA